MQSGSGGFREFPEWDGGGRHLVAVSPAAEKRQELEVGLTY